MGSEFQRSVRQFQSSFNQNRHILGFFHGLAKQLFDTPLKLTFVYRLVSARNNFQVGIFFADDFFVQFYKGAERCHAKKRNEEHRF
jgi:hypothetical protein